MVIDGRSGGSDDGLVGNPLVHLVDDLPHGLEVAKHDVEGSDPVRCDAVGDVSDMPSPTASAILPPRGCGGPLDPKMVLWVAAGLCPPRTWEVSSG